MPSLADPGVDRPGLRLERVADAVVVDDRAVRVERVRHERLLEEGDHVRLQGEAGLGGGGVGRREVVVDGVDDRQPAGRLGAAQVVVADRGRGQVAGLRVGGVPEPGGPAVLGDRVLRREPVGDRDLALGHGDLEAVGRLVGLVVADRVPGHRALGLAHHHGAVSRGHPPVEGALDVLGPGGGAAVGDDDPGRLARLELRSGLDRQLPHAGRVVLDLPVRRALDRGAGRGRRHLAGGLPVDRDRLHVHAAQVEVEAVQVLRGHEVDGRHTAQLADERRRGGRRRCVGEVEVVVLDVVPAVAGEREVGVARAGGAGGVPRPARAGLRRRWRPPTRRVCPSPPAPPPTPRTLACELARQSSRTRIHRL